MSKTDNIIKIDFGIDVRYEPDLITAFNKFIKKWCGDNYPHLIDSDDNDGEFIREKIRAKQTALLDRVEKLIGDSKRKTNYTGDKRTMGYNKAINDFKSQIAEMRKKL